MASSYEQIYTSIVGRLAHLDLKEAAARVGFPAPVDGEINVPFLGRVYRLHAGGVEAVDGGPSDPNCRSILIYYVTSKGRGEPRDTYCLPHYFINGTFGSGNLSWQNEPLVRAYGDSVESIRGPLDTLGAIYQGEPKQDYYIWNYQLLPKIPMQLCYAAGDEDFPCCIDLMLDQGANRYLEFEQLAFLCGCFIQALLDANK